MINLRYCTAIAVYALLCNTMMNKSGCCVGIMHTSNYCFSIGLYGYKKCPEVNISLPVRFK